LLHTARSTIAMSLKDENDCRNTDEQVHKILDGRPHAEDEIHDIPIAAHPISYRNETPVESTDNYENKRRTT